MTTSGITAWEMTALDVVTAAMQELGAISMGEVPEASELDAGIVRLNAMLKTWSVKGNLFREATATVVIPGGTGAGTLPDSVAGVSTARLVVSATYERPLTQWNRDQFYRLPNRTTVGQPTMFYTAQNLGTTSINVWPVPADDVTLHLDYLRAAETVTEAEETLDIPPEWQEAAYLGLAVRIAPMLGSTRLDPNTVMDVQNRARDAYNLLLDHDRPDSYYFEAAESWR